MKKLPLNAPGLSPDEVKPRPPLTHAKLFTSRLKRVFEVMFLTELPKATIKRVFKDAGADRVSGDVPERVNEIVTEMAKAAVESAEEDGRKTVSPRDLKLVVVS
ncbi:hypothetical protein AKJ61_03030 [candidate division MSBL1 archaeon SCGC-AAA259B11]|uniref:Transcription factor CBF/NF-Y/archaeal histone domain-containing protein n=1 Tax=candidate division MSBL1 archaeon SCGC-AAA259B11 TaxID=1698260 RepID=A0A133U594_9EURY|nr:hypothetical protein AKJ61_03030 [candidate division MSBL1 archaeon SCGC-AAA259B11]